MNTLKQMLKGANILDKGRITMSNILVVLFALFLNLFFELKTALLIILGLLLISFTISTFKFIKWLKRT